MKVVIQKTTKASVTVGSKVVGSIGKGLVVLVGFTYDDKIEDLDKMVDKVVNLRIFDDENGVMNRSLLDEQGSILSISQFTLYDDTKKGRRPSYVNALNGEEAIKLYDAFNKKLAMYAPVETGIFGADMKVELINDGPTTIIIESEKRTKI